jgi:hypothetical protein
VLEDEVDNEGDTEALVVGGRDDAVRALAASIDGPDGPSGGSLLLRRALPCGARSGGVSGRGSDPYPLSPQQCAFAGANKMREDGWAQKS